LKSGSSRNFQERIVQEASFKGYSPSFSGAKPEDAWRLRLKPPQQQDHEYPYEK